MSDAGTRRFVPTRPPVRWRLWALVAVVCAAALAVTLPLAGERWWPSERRCAPGVTQRGPGQECVGVTDGSYVYGAEFAEVSAKIREENERVARSGEDWVSIAYTEPMTRRSGSFAPSDRSPEVTRQAIEGAYLAQVELNRGGGHGRTPQIKLLLANSGQGGEQWRPLVEQLVELARDGDHRLVAVAGFGQSVATTKQAVDALRAAEIPMVGSTVAADDLSTPDPTFFRVSSPNADQTAVAADYLRGRQARGARIDVVKDIKRDDTYNQSLGADFARAAKAARLRLETPDGHRFVSGSPSAANTLADIADTVCRPERRLDAVYFAGRGRELKLFVEALTSPGRDCPLTVLSGSSALGVFYDPPVTGSDAVGGDVLARWRASKGLRVLYTAYAHPEGAARVYPTRAANPYPAFADAYDLAFGGDRELRSGQAMMGHDSVLALGTAIRDAAGPRGADEVDAAGVRNMLLQIGQSGPLPGLSGPIAFDAKGNPHRKPMALVELRPEPERRYTYRATVRATGAR
ncbi:ABC transporter substrate-binding protein [Streptomyces sp. NPDC057702]|uniref:ABC transporter substrate-binding protein n=1 Tax=unclassified Streptomyces TaxID=2593676 RepID=UPI0036C633B3